MENSTHSFRKTNLVLQLRWKSQTKIKIVISQSSRKKKESIFCTFYFVRGKLSQHLCSISMYSELITLLEYAHFYI